LVFRCHCGYPVWVVWMRLVFMALESTFLVETNKSSLSRPFSAELTS